MVDEGTDDVPWGFGISQLRVFAHSTEQWRLFDPIGNVFPTTDRIGAFDQAAVPSIMTFAHSSSVTDRRFNKSGVGTDTNIFSASNNFYIGAVTLNNTFTALKGILAEIIVYDRRLSFGEMIQIENYLASKWGIADQSQSAIGVIGGGQSNMRGYFQSFGANNNNGELAYEGNAELAFGWSDVDFVNGATNGSYAVKAHAVSTSQPDDWWFDPVDGVFGNSYDAWESAALASINPTELILWDQGESDAFKIGSTAQNFDPAKAADYEASLLAIFNKMRSIVGTVPVLIVPIGRRGDSFFLSGWQAIREIQQKIAAQYDWIFLAPEKFDLDLHDDVHLSDTAYETQAVRIAQKSRHVLGQALPTGVDGPEITSVSRSGTSVTVTIAHEKGTNFSPGSAIAGFEFWDGGYPANGDINGSEIAITSAVRTNSTTITLTLASEPTGSEYLIYGQSSMIPSRHNHSNLVVDTQGLPLRSAVIAL